MVTGAAVAFGLTEGAANAPEIRLTPLGRRVVAPTEEGDDKVALREALLKPRVTREFLSKYDRKKLPPEPIARNVLSSLGVASDATQRSLRGILASARFVGVLRKVNGDDKWVELKGAQIVATSADQNRELLPGQDALDEDEIGVEELTPDAGGPVAPPALPQSANNKVFITHGKNQAVVAQIKEILLYGKFEPVVSEEKETTAKPVPDKVLEDMRGCYAAVVHVGTERVLLDETGEEQRILNQNVLIEIGAAMALFKQRFVLLVEKGVKLPSNLQGLYEVRYEGDGLDHEATMKLLKSFNEFREE